MRVFELLDHLRIQGIKFESVKINYRKTLYEFKGIANPRKDKFKNFISEVNDYKELLDAEVRDWEVRGIVDNLALGMSIDTCSNLMHLYIDTVS